MLNSVTLWRSLLSFSACQELSVRCLYWKCPPPFDHRCHCFFAYSGVLVIILVKCSSDNRELQYPGQFFAAMLWLHSMGGVSQRTGIKADHSKRVVMLSYCGPPKVAWRSPILSWPRIMFFMFSHLGWQDGTFGALSYCVHRMTFMSKKCYVFKESALKWYLYQGIHYKSYKGACAQSTTWVKIAGDIFFFTKRKKALALQKPSQD